MDEENRRGLMRIIGSDPEGKVYTLLEFAGLSRGIADPWYTRDFEATYQDLMLGLNAFIDRI